MKLFLIIFAFLYFFIGILYFSFCLVSFDVGFLTLETFRCICIAPIIDLNLIITMMGFYGAIIAFFIPHSIDMISKIGKKYESESIANRFRDEKNIKNLHIHLLLGVFIGFFLIVFYKINLNILNNILFYILSFHFIFVIYLIYEYITKLKHYSNTDDILAQIQNEIKNEFK